MKICDFCGNFEPLTIEAKETARVICSRCAWRCVDLLVARSKTDPADLDLLPHEARCTP